MGFMFATSWYYRILFRGDGNEERDAFRVGGDKIVPVINMDFMRCLPSCFILSGPVFRTANSHVRRDRACSVRAAAAR
jgi:hypothetical protein